MFGAMTRLSVNVNKFATLRNSRGKNNPDVLQAALNAVRFGAAGVTVHPRPDGRHIRFADVLAISQALQAHPQIEFNIEGYPEENLLKLVETVRPHQCTLVPDPPDALTSNAGWRVLENQDFLKPVTQRLHAASVRVSVFMDPTASRAELQALASMGVERIELYTEKYAEDFATPQQEATLQTYVQTARVATELGLELNAGHDLNLQNLRTLISAIPQIREVSIGHALVCDALYLGYEESVRQYLACLTD